MVGVCSSEISSWLFTLAGLMLNAVPVNGEQPTCIMYMYMYASCQAIFRELDETFFYLALPVFGTTHIGNSKKASVDFLVLSEFGNL